MNGFFSPEGKFYTVCSKIVDMVILTLMWIVGCIPIVTIVTSTASLYHAAVKCVRYEQGRAWVDFMDAYKKNFSQGVMLTFLYGALGFFLARLDYRVFFLSRDRSMTVFVLAVGALILSCVFLSNVLWLIPLFSRFARSTGSLMQLVFVVSLRYFLRSIPMVLMVVAAVILVSASIGLILILPCAMFLAFSYLTEPVLHKYMPKQEEDNGDWRYGFC